MTSLNIILIPLYYIKKPPLLPLLQILGGEVIGGLLQPVKLYFLIIPQKPPYPLPLPLSGAMGFIGGLLLIMPVMTAPANHTHYSAWTGTLIIAYYPMRITVKLLRFAIRVPLPFLAINPTLVSLVRVTTPCIVSIKKFVPSAVLLK